MFVVHEDVDPTYLILISIDKREMASFFLVKCVRYIATLNGMSSALMVLRVTSLMLFYTGMTKYHILSTLLKAKVSLDWKCMSFTVSYN